MEIPESLQRFYFLYAGILCLKILFMTLITVINRLSKGVFVNPEDSKGSEVKKDETVERIRRAHLNDLENIVPFLILGGLYLTTGPYVFVAKALFRVFTLSRIIYSYAYITGTQPARRYAFRTSFLIVAYMGMQAVLHYITEI